jgi:hypothetical protein
LTVVFVVNDLQFRNKFNLFLRFVRSRGVPYYYAALRTKVLHKMPALRKKMHWNGNNGCVVVSFHRDMDRNIVIIRARNID